MTTYLYTGPIPINQSTTLKFGALVDGVMSAIQEENYTINKYIDFTEAPYTTVNAQRDATIHYSTIAYGLWETQQAQAESITGMLKFIGTASESQPKQAEAISGSLKMSATLAESQRSQTEVLAGSLKFISVAVEAHAKQTESASAVLQFIGSISETQPPQSESITAVKNTLLPTLRFIAPNPPQVDSGGVIHYSTEEIIVGYTGAIVEMSPLQQEIAMALLMFSGDIAEVHGAQTENIAAITMPTGVDEWQQPQQESITAEMMFIGVIEEVQKAQRESISGGKPAANPDRFYVAVHDPLAMAVTVRDPLAMAVTVRDPLAFNVVMTSH